MIDLLVLPLTKVIGVEDPHRPNGLWQQAWTIAQSYLPDNGLIVLAANPRHFRTQDQLHIHILHQQPGIINYPGWGHYYRGAPGHAWGAYHGGPHYRNGGAGSYHRGGGRSGGHYRR